MSEQKPIYDKGSHTSAIERNWEPYSNDLMVWIQRNYQFNFSYSASNSSSLVTISVLLSSQGLWYHPKLKFKRYMGGI